MLCRCIRRIGDWYLAHCSHRQGWGPSPTRHSRCPAGGGWTIDNVLCTPGWQAGHGNPAPAVVRPLGHRGQSTRNGGRKPSPLSRLAPLQGDRVTGQPQTQLGRSTRLFPHSFHFPPGKLLALLSYAGTFVMATRACTWQVPGKQATSDKQSPPADRNRVDGRDHAGTS